jgi:hypothetical protein
MKITKTLSTLSLGLALGLLTQGNVASADETVTTTKSTTYSGVVSELNPSSSTLILKSETSPSPVTYTYSKETTFVDSAGNPVSSSAILNSPVTVEYSNEGGRTVVRRVVQTGPARVHQKTTTERRTDD